MARIFAQQKSNEARSKSIVLTFGDYVLWSHMLFRKSIFLLAFAFARAAFYDIVSGELRLQEVFYSENPNINPPRLLEHKALGPFSIFSPDQFTPQKVVAFGIDVESGRETAFMIKVVESGGVVIFTLEPLGIISKYLSADQFESLKRGELGNVEFIVLGRAAAKSFSFAGMRARTIESHFIEEHTEDFALPEEVRHTVTCISQDNLTADLLGRVNFIKLLTKSKSLFPVSFFEWKSFDTNGHLIAGGESRGLCDLYIEIPAGDMLELFKHRLFVTVEGCPLITRVPVGIHNDPPKCVCGLFNYLSTPLPQLNMSSETEFTMISPEGVQSEIASGLLDITFHDSYSDIVQRHVRRFVHSKCRGNHHMLPSPLNGAEIVFRDCEVLFVPT